MKRTKGITFTIIALLMILSYWLHYELRMERKFRKSDKTAIISHYTNQLDSVKTILYIKDSIVMDCEGVIKDKKDAIRLKQIYNKAK